MALTIHQKPQVLTPAYNPQTFVALSPGIANPDFKYQVSVTVNGSSDVYTEDVLQRPDGYLVFDPIEWVKNYIEHYFNPALSLASPLEIATNKTVQVVVNISDYWSGTPQTSLSETYYAFDGCLTDLEFRSYQYADYLFGVNTDKWFLSKSASTITPDSRIILTQDHWLHFIQDPADVVDVVNIELRRGASLIQAVLPGIPTPVYTYDTLVMQVSPKIFTAPLVGDTVRVDFKVGVTLKLRYSYVIQQIESDYQDYVIYYLDRDGNILSFHFEKLSRKTSNKKTNKVNLNPNRLNTTTHQYGSKTWDRERFNVSTSITDSVTLNTGWIDEAQATQLKECWSSPQTWLWDGSNLIAIDMPDEVYEEPREPNDPLFNYTVTIDLGVTETRQRGI